MIHEIAPASLKMVMIPFYPTIEPGFDIVVRGDIWYASKSKVPSILTINKACDRLREIHSFYSFVENVWIYFCAPTRKSDGVQKLGSYG